MNQLALPTIAVMLIAYGALSSRLRTTPVSQAMVFVALGLLAGTAAGLALFPLLNLWTAAALATMLAPTDAALGCRWSPTGNCPRESARASTSRAA